jgi:AraC-like DNA-binding protein
MMSIRTVLGVPKPVSGRPETDSRHPLPPMLTLPLPVVVALALLYTAARSWFGGDRARRPPLLVLLVVAAAAQSLLVALVQHYGVTGLRWLQPVTASALPPLTWCAFVAVQVRPLRGRDAWHGLVPLLVLLSLLFVPVWLDLLVVGSFASYGVALLLALRPGGAELPLSRLASDNVPRWLWQFVALTLLVSALFDGLIYLDQLMQLGEFRALLISAMSSLMLLALGLIGLSPEWRMPESFDDSRGAQRPLNHNPSASVEAEPAEGGLDAADPALLARLDDYMGEARPWLNPDLTLLALARKLGVPSKTLSAAVNLGYGENVARYVNRRRIEHACDLLRRGQPVTSALYDSGFNTKSNFHREFQRLHGMTPTQWLEQVGTPSLREGFRAPADDSVTTVQSMKADSSGL